TAGDEVAKGQLIATAKGRVSANIFSSVSGKVVGIEKRKNVFGILSDYIHIKAEGDSVSTLAPLENATKESVLARISESGIVGLGGAGFPAAVKDCPNKPVDTLIINCAECEPYLNCDNRLMLEKTDGVVQGIKLLAKAIGVEKIIVGIEDNKMEAYETLKKTGLDVQLLEKKYPQGAEKMLIYALTKRKVPNKGGLPMDVGVVVHNPATAYAVYEACVLGKPLYERILTVSGKGVDNPKNLLVLNGTPHKAIYEFCGLNDDAVKLISGGPMMGIAMGNLDGVTTKTESGLLALTHDEIAVYEPSNCISCGRCARACPMKLMPMFIDFNVLAGKLDEAAKYGAMDCIECGSCSFVCPAKRPLVANIKRAKLMLKEKK
ncbi:MAG: electron transport complex subunit RsxC, partial [Clostridia bacterium]